MRAARLLHWPPCGKLWDMADDDPTPDTRTSLIRRVCALDPESWTEFVRLYDTLLQAYIASCNQRSQLALDDTDREDIKQEVLIRLYHKLPSFKTDMRFRTWLWPVTRNVVIDWVRQQRGRGKMWGGERGQRPAKVALTLEMAESLQDAGEAPDEQLIRAHDQFLLRHILDKVKEEMQSSKKWDCFALHYLDGKPSSEVAEALGISVALVNTNTSRIRARIRAWCQDYDVEL
jgi:RNA polymerase sigma factor (sigma-70 family)